MSAALGADMMPSVWAAVAVGDRESRGEVSLGHVTIGLSNLSDSGYKSQ